MKITLNGFLALGLSFLFHHEIRGSIKCHVCNKVKTDNSCFHETFTCQGGYKDFCFTRRILQGDKVIKIQRGCTISCGTKMNTFRLVKIETLCCKRRLCNTHNLWPGPSTLVHLHRGPREEVAGLVQRAVKHGI